MTDKLALQARAGLSNRLDLVEACMQVYSLSMLIQ